MSLTKSRLLASGLAVVGLAGAIALGFAAPHLSRGLLPSGTNHAALESSKMPAASGPLLVADKQKDGAQAKTPAPRGESRGKVQVEAPSTSVNVDRERGKVQVTAPHTNVQVDPDKGRVQVRAPYVNLDIRW